MRRADAHRMHNPNGGIPMQMLSTRGAAAVTPSMAILRGLAPEIAIAETRLI